MRRCAAADEMRDASQQPALQCWRTTARTLDRAAPGGERTRTRALINPQVRVVLRTTRFSVPVHRICGGGRAGAAAELRSWCEVSPPPTQPASRADRHVQNPRPQEPQQTADGWIQRAQFAHPDLHNELVDELVPLSSPFSTYSSQDGSATVFTFVLLGDQNAGKSTFLHSFVCASDSSWLQLMSYLPILASSFVNVRLLPPGCASPPNPSPTSGGPTPAPAPLFMRASPCRM